MGGGIQSITERSPGFASFYFTGPPSSAAIYSLAKKNTFASISLSKRTQALPDPWWVSASCRQATRREVLSS